MRVDGDTPIRTPDPSRLSRADSVDPTGDVLMAKIVACGRGPTIDQLEARIAELEAELAALKGVLE